MKFNKLKTTAFSEMINGAGMFLNKFDVTGATEVADADILFTTSGGVSISATPTFLDLGEGVDNAPKNMKEFKVIDDYECTMGGTSLTATETAMNFLLPGSSVDSTTGKISISKNIAASDFKDIWFVGDKSDGGMIAVRLMNALSTGGFTLQSTDKEKGTFAFTFMGHFSAAAQDVVPMEIYVADGI